MSKSVENDLAWVHMVTDEFAKRARRREAHERQTPRSQSVHIFRIPWRLLKSHKENYESDLMFLGLFPRLFAHDHPSAGAKFKIEVVDAFIEIMNAERTNVKSKQERTVNARDTRNSKEEMKIEIPVPKTRSFQEEHSREEMKFKRSLTTSGATEAMANSKDGISGVSRRNTYTDKCDWEQLKDRLIEDPRKAHNQYSLDEYKGDDVTRNVLALDSVFLCVYLQVYLFRKNHDHSFRQDSLFFQRSFFDIILTKSASFHYRIVNDIAKLQNQIPLYLIGQVLEFAHGSHNDTSQDLVQRDLVAICRNWVHVHSNSLPGFRTQDLDLQSIYFQDCDHLLACLCRMTQTFENTSVSSSAGSTFSARSQSLQFKFHKFENVIKRWLRVLSTPSLQESMEKDAPDISLPSATRMRECGIYFRGKESGSMNLVPVFKRRFLNLSAILYIPSITVGSNTETLWRNMLAFLHEDNTAKSAQHGAKEFIDFLMFMDELIDSQEDVVLLRNGKHRVIQKNFLGTNIEVAELFNTIVYHQVADGGGYAPSFQSLRLQIDEFLQQKPRIVFLQFLKYNFGKPWLVIGVVIGFLVIAMTFLQTLYTILGFYPH